MWSSSPNGTRTRVSTLRGWCPRPLDDGAVPRRRLGASDRGRTRTYNPLIKSQLLCQLSYTAAIIVFKVNRQTKSVAPSRSPRLPSATKGLAWRSHDDEDRLLRERLTAGFTQCLGQVRHDGSRELVTFPHS